MIKAVFYKKNGCLSGFSLSGHAGYAESGKDIVCAAVSSAAELTCNTITDYFNDEEAEVVVGTDRLTLTMKGNSCEYSEMMIRSFINHLEFISAEFKNSINISYKEIN